MLSDLYQFNSEGAIGAAPEMTRRALDRPSALRSLRRIRMLIKGYAADDPFCAEAVFQNPPWNFFHGRGTEKENGRLNAAQVTLERGQRLREVNFHTTVLTGCGNQQTLGDVGQRQGGEQTVILPRPKTSRAHAYVARRTVQVNGTLGVTGGT